MDTDSEAPDLASPLEHMHKDHKGTASNNSESDDGLAEEEQQLGEWFTSMRKEIEEGKKQGESVLRAMHDNMPTTPAPPALDQPLDWRRWLMLLTICTAGAVSGVATFTFAPVTEQVANVWGCGPYKVSLIAVASFFVFPLASVAGNYAMSRRGFQTVVLTASTLQAVGCWVRVLGAISPVGKFAVSLLGQLILSCSAPLFLIAPSALAVKWFPAQERGSVVALSSGAYMLGVAFVFVLAPYAMHSATSDALFELCFVVAFGATCATALVFASLSTAPPRACVTGTVLSIEEEEVFSFWHASWFTVFRDAGFLSSALAAAVATFTTNAVATFLSILADGEGFTAVSKGYLGLLYMLAVLFGRSAAIFCMEFTASLKTYLQASLLLTSLAMLYFTFSVPSSLGHMTLSLLCLGVCVGTISPVAERIGIVSSYPISHGRVMAIQQVFGHAVSFFVLLVAIFISAYWQRHGEHTVLMIVGFAAMTSSGSALLFGLLYPPRGKTPLPHSSAAAAGAAVKDHNHSSFGSMARSPLFSETDEDSYGLPEYNL